MSLKCAKYHANFFGRFKDVDDQNIVIFWIVDRGPIAFKKPRIIINWKIYKCIVKRRGPAQAVQQFSRI